MKTIKLKEPTLPDWATLEYDNGVQEFDPSTLTLHFEPEQKDGYISGNELRERLSDDASANLSTLEYLQKHPDLLPEEWEGKYVYGWGTIVRDRDTGNLRVPYLIENEGEVVLDWFWLGSDWLADDPALRFRTSSESSNIGTFVPDLPSVLVINNVTYKRV